MNHTIPPPPTPQLLRQSLAAISGEIPPQSPEQQEAYFQEQVAEGEKLALMGTYGRCGLHCDRGGRGLIAGGS
jgi:hypothetical protein